MDRRRLELGREQEWAVVEEKKVLLTGPKAEKRKMGRESNPDPQEAGSMT